MDISHSICSRHKSNSVEHTRLYDALMHLVERLKLDRHLRNLNEITFISLAITDLNTTTKKPIEVYVYGTERAADAVNLACSCLNRSLETPIYLSTDDTDESLDGDISIHLREDIFIEENQEHIFLICKTLILAASTAMNISKHDSGLRFKLVKEQIG